MKQTYKDATGTSFHNSTIKATVNELTAVLNAPVYSKNDGTDKVNFEWNMETDEGDIFTVYDWKEYRELEPNEPIIWHIGGMSKSITETAKADILAALQPVKD